MRLEFLALWSFWLMARFVWVIKALSPRDGGWVRWACGGMGHFETEEDAWRFVIAMWGVAVAAGDYETMDVVRTIAF